MVYLSVVSCSLRLKVKGYGRMKWKRNGDVTLMVGGCCYI